ncbi:MAG: glycoside hydrolase family 88 protein [Ignavibacteriaceae bacterium]|nr:glycoside hydrolase family 88 protein [Ignavibacteriaceae bacterium]
MKILKLFFLILIVLFFSNYTYSQKNKIDKIFTPEELASNFLKLYPDSIIYKGQINSKKWNYEQGFILQAFYQMWLKSGNNEYLNYIKRNLDYYVDDNGNIKTYKIEDLNLDNIAPGSVLLNIYNITKNKKYKKAADILREQLREQPRTKEGGFWHKKIYPDQMWLDGLFMAEPFYSEYTSLLGNEDSFNDIANQFLLIEKYCKDKQTGLYYHGWDETKSQKWADSVTGTSKIFWGRAMGWYLMALVDVLDYFPLEHPQRKELIKIFRDLSLNLLMYRDPQMKLWFQVVNKVNEKGNFIETSASSMFIYAYAKGYNNGYLPLSYYNIAEESFNSVQLNYLKKNNDLLNLENVCAGAGLGGNPYRDGSYNYYISEPMRVNDFKGYGSLLLASIELSKKKLNAKNRRVGLDYFYNNEYKNQKRFHYIWEDTENSGFSVLGNIIEHSGAVIDSIVKAPTSEILKQYDIYIIVDPDTPQETLKPNYIDDIAIGEITSWVKNGGVLILMANDSTNCEFTHLNKLAGEFGIHFNEDSENRVIGNNYVLGTFDNLPNHPLFKKVNKIFLKEISSINISKDAEPLLVRGNKIFMASSKYGKGFVFAVGDPWLYNEYIDSRKLPEGFENYKAAQNLFQWLLNKTSNNKN